MPAGLEVYDAAGRLVSSVTDRLTKLIQTGSASLGVGQIIFVPVPGMSTNGEWFIACSHGNIAVPAANGFNWYQTGEYGGSCNYSVFRW